MSENPDHFTLYGKSPLFQLFFSLFIILFVGVLLLYMLLLVCTLIFGVDWTTLIKSISADPDVSNIVLLRIMIISQDISLFIMPGIIILTLMKKNHPGSRISITFPHLNEVVLVIILGFCIFPVTSFTGQINSGMHLPDWLSGIEKWMTEKENQANGVIDQLLTSHTLTITVLNLIMIAVLPAIGEELIFRGVFQKIFSHLFKSGHIAIWFTAFLFSVLHFQFFGFIPRFILGLVFGYLFFWSGTLWLPVISHFVNNAFPVILAYIQGMEKLNSPIDVPLWKQVIVLPVPVIIGLVILFYFRNNNKVLKELGEIKSQNPNTV